MKHSISQKLVLVIPLLSVPILQSFTTYNAPFEYENRYNANSFIFNNEIYHKRHTPLLEEPLGDEAIEELATKKNKPKKGRRLFTRYRNVSEK